MLPIPALQRGPGFIQASALVLGQVEAQPLYLIPYLRSAGLVLAGCGEAEVVLHRLVHHALMHSRTEPGQDPEPVNTACFFVWSTWTSHAACRHARVWTHTLCRTTKGLIDFP